MVGPEPHQAMNRRPLCPGLIPCLGPTAHRHSAGAEVGPLLIAKTQPDGGGAKALDAASGMGCSDACQAIALTSAQWPASTKTMSVAKHLEAAPPSRVIGLLVAFDPKPGESRLWLTTDAIRKELHGSNRPGMFHVEHGKVIATVALGSRAHPASSSR